MLQRFAVLPAVLTLALTALAGCNTVEGLGEDLDRAGEELDEAF